jgi:hypothetical protein
MTTPSNLIYSNLSSSAAQRVSTNTNPLFRTPPHVLIVQYTVRKPSLANLSYIPSPLQVPRFQYPNNSTWPEYMMNVFVISIYTVNLFHKHEIKTS